MQYSTAPAWAQHCGLLLKAIFLDDVQRLFLKGWWQIFFDDFRSIRTNKPPLDNSN